MHVALHVVELLRFATSWPDRHVLDLLTEGGTIIGDLEPVGIFRQKNIHAEVSRDDLLATADSWHDETCS